MNYKFSSVKQYEILSALNDLESFKCRQIMQNYDKFRDGVRKELIFKALTVYLDKEEKSLENIWTVLNTENLTDHGRMKKGFRDYNSGSPALQIVKQGKNL